MRTFKVSVVVPIRDEESTIGTLLECLSAQTRRPDEVVLVDGGSTDRTRVIVQDFMKKADGIRLISAGRAYPGEGRNAGIEKAEHEVIALTDAGVRLDPEWLEKLCVPVERDPSIAVVYGSYEPVTNTFFEQCAALAYVPARLGSDKGNIRGPFIASTLFRKEVWAAVGGFPDYRASEDLIFIERVEQGGFRTAYAPGARCYWQLAPGWRATFRRFALYSYHNLVAGRGRYWHKGVMRYYLAALPFAVLGVVHDFLWFCVPLAGFVARVGRTIWPKRKEFGIRGPLRLSRWAGVTLLLGLIDIATGVGALAWAWRRAIRGVRGLRTGQLKVPRSLLKK
jgi:glycosyltransferase involved in cell wall biosynthesis